ncbi:hypothetical protein SAMN06309944_2343 [Micrococcales bacterium KH10]|nr:hypothetical protein SAMN06309944_2343 [Micrococcales bacterium KH10]
MPTSTEQLTADLIDATDAIEAALREQHRLESLHGLGAVTRATIALGDPIVRYYGVDLWRLAAHREAVTHEHVEASSARGVLDEAVVTRAKRLLQEITQPTPAIRIASSAIMRATSADSLGIWLRQMRERDISQIPVYDRGVFAGLLTTNAVARWLAGQIDERGDALIESALVRHVLPHVEPAETVAFLPKEVSAAQVVALLRSANPPAAIILTASGRDVDPPQGLMVAADLQELDDALSV